MTPLPRRPLVGIAVAFTTGIGLGLDSSGPILPVLAISLAALLLAVCLHSSGWRRCDPALDTLILLCVLGAGWLCAALEDNVRRAPDFTPSTADIELIGIVADEPATTISTPKQRGWSFPLTVDQVRAKPPTTWSGERCCVRVYLFAPSQSRKPAYGERWSFTGRLERPLFRQGVKAGQAAGVNLVASARDAHFVGTGHVSGVRRACFAARGRAAEILSDGIQDFPEQISILTSLLLGYYGQIPRELYQAFAATGTLHVFAISGSHVVIVCMIIIVVLTSCGIPRTRWILFLGPLLALYTIMTGLQVSALRACVMAVLFWLAPFLGRKADVYTALSAAAVLILCFDPHDLAGTGFVLSFVAVIGLVMFHPVFAPLLSRPFRRDPLQVTPDTVWRMWLRRMGRYTADLLAMSLSAWLISAPLTAWYFETLSPIGILGNLVAVPLASLVIVTGFLSLTIGACVGSLADLFNHANLFLINALTAAIRVFASVPCGSFRVGVPPVWLLLVFYVLLGIWRFVRWVGQRPGTIRHGPSDGR